MKKLKCVVCDADIVCTLKREDLYFYIENDKIKCDKNPDLWADYPYQFHCSNDYEHPIALDNDWCLKFEKEIENLISEV